MRYHNHFDQNRNRLCGGTCHRCLSGLNAQTPRARVTVSGHITDKASGETLIGAGVITDGAGAATNTYGFYTLTILKGESA